MRGNGNSPDICRRLAAFARVEGALVKSFANAAILWNRNPIVLSKHCVVQSGVAVLRPCDDGYASRLPTAEDVLLMVEIEGMDIALSRVWKARLYAGSGVPECWLVDLVEQRLEVHCSPDQKTYRLVRDIGSGGSVAPRLLVDYSVRVTDLLLPAARHCT